MKIWTSGQIGAIFKCDFICIGQGGDEKSLRMDHLNHKLIQRLANLSAESKMTTARILKRKD